MTFVRIDLCANGAPISALQIEGVDTSKYTRTVPLDDSVTFANAVIYFIGCGHGCRALPQFADVVFSVELDGSFNEDQVLQVDALMQHADRVLRLVLGSDGFTMDIDNWSFTALVPKKH